MTFSRIWPLGLALGEVLYSDDLNALDIALTYALDSRGGDYTLSSALHLLGNFLRVDNLQIDNLVRSNGWSPWPSVAQLDDATYEAFNPTSILTVRLIDNWTAQRSVQLVPSTTTLTNSIVVFARHSSPPSGVYAIIADGTRSGLQIATVTANGELSAIFYDGTNFREFWHLTP